MIVVEPTLEVPLMVGVVEVLFGLAGVLAVIDGVVGVAGFVWNCCTEPKPGPPEFVARFALASSPSAD